MGPIEYWISVAVMVALMATIIVAVWVCFWRTRRRSFLFLAIVVTIWPFFDMATAALQRHFVHQVFEGKTPWLFPFSLRISGGPQTGWQMTTAEFITRFGMAKHVLFLGLMAMAFLFIARSFRNKASGRSDLKG